MRPLGLAAFLLVVASTSCAVLGIDFSDKPDATGTGGASVGHGGAGQGGVASVGGGGAGGGTETCGGIEILKGLEASKDLFELVMGGGPACTSAWMKGPMATFNVAANLSGSCLIGSPWFFDARGRRFIGHLASPLGNIGTAPGGLVVLDPRGQELALAITSMGMLTLEVIDLLGMGTPKSIVGGTLGVDTFVALHFSSDGKTLAVESASEKAQGQWTARISGVDLEKSFPAPFDVSGLSPGVFESAALDNTAGGNIALDQVHGDLDTGVTGSGVACPVESLKEAFNGPSLPATFSDPGSCARFEAGHLKLCGTASSLDCVVASHHLYRLAGSSMHARVVRFDKPAGFVRLGFHAPPAAVSKALAQLELSASGVLAAGISVTTIATGQAAPLFLDIFGSYGGDVSYGWHKAQGDPPTTVTAGQSKIATDAMGYVLLHAALPSAVDCVEVDALDLP